MDTFHFILVLFALSSQIPSCLCLGTWTWMYGEKTTGSSGVYDQKGVANPSYIPRSAAYGTSSYDKNTGTLWFFGGSPGSGKKYKL
jgi:hypothetical protein